MLPLLLIVVPALALAPGPVDARVQQVARILAPLTDVRAVSLSGPASFCTGEQEDALWLQIEHDSKRGLDCILRSTRAPRCAATSQPLSKRKTPICPPKDGGPSAVPAPDWISRLTPLLLDEDAPVGIEPLEGGVGLHLTHGADHFVMIRAATGWLLLPQSIGLSDAGDPRNELYVVETTQMTKSQSWGVIAAFYDGGTGLGQQDTELYVVTPEKDALRIVAQRTIGVSRWVAADEARPRSPVGRVRRYEVAVSLKPTFTPDGLLKLRLTKQSLGHLSQFCSRKEIAGNQAVDSEICPLPLITRVRDDRGIWKLSGEKWMRVTAPAPRRPLHARAAGAPVRTPAPPRSSSACCPC